MFSFLKQNPVKAMRQKYDAKAEQAMLAQRKGDMRLFADLTAEAEELWLQLEKLQAAVKK
ncbi:MAG: Lacal_2735 family protein [Gammaproteobacteria bacterium]|nr:Lacal_2735 family protein [Gammaproteobacteria bacterium]